ncbi:MAG: ABC transporter permease [Proteobacteria bacterium]|nr:ABC transporter permease [Pseudomonadota bacterium]
MYIKQLYQLFVLMQRNLQVIFADKLNLSLLFLQVPIIAILIVVAFYNFAHDKQNFDEAARILYYFGQMKQPLEQARKTVNIDKLHRYAKVLAKNTNIQQRYEYINKVIGPFFIKKNVSMPNLLVKGRIELISNMASMRRGSVYFLLVAASIWFGIMGSCKEIVTEQHILKRESRSYLFILPYITAKNLVLAIILGIQTGLLSVMVVPLLLKLIWINIVIIWLILWLTAFVAASMGLFISSLVTSYRVTLTLIPLLMIPQLLFGGLLRPPVDLETNTWSQIAKNISAITIQRWAFEAILTTDTYAQGGILKLQFNPQSNNELNLVQANNSSLVNSFFTTRDNTEHLWQPLLYLTIAGLLFFIGSYMVLRWRFT